ncbi:amidohydrolase 3 [Penicillium pulvis]|uniref:amidohydrolase 3 n=1 Tax=Penicillium pulvis TaxID=1562058 RepID=UPI00254698D8|nr:amidohydrolase 3 [Penicillium pulvis]KAJ5786560.1 amidohydrolase 3 [Penicillium pulvis]
MSRVTIFKNCRAFCPENGLSDDEFLGCFVVKGNKFTHVGYDTDEEVQAAKLQGAQIIDLKNQVVVPGFIDSHTHFLLFGLALQKLDLSGCKCFQDIERAIIGYAKEHPELPRILCRGWHQPSTNSEAFASMIDHIDARPIFIEALDLHSTWCNTRALKEMGVETIPDPPGGKIHRTEDGSPSGLMEESAQTGIVWPHLMNISTVEERLTALKDALAAYLESGYTGLVDMAMDSTAWEALRLLRESQHVPIHVAAHWYIPFTDDKDELSEYIDEAIAKHSEFHPTTSPEFCVVGIKIIADGVVDGCTAALSHPYSGVSPGTVDPIWPLESMKWVVKRAADAGLQVAIHAIGDVTIKNAIDSIEAASSPRGRHRIEHLELASVVDAKRLGELGITASIQPVHSDPVLTKAYPKILQPRLWDRVFPYREYLDGHACVAIGTDAPTAKHLPLPNLYNATTRKSALDPSSSQTTNPVGAISLIQAAIAATSGAAYSRFAEGWTGSIAKGHRADFVVLETEWTSETLLNTIVQQTWALGEKVFDQRMAR